VERIVLGDNLPLLRELEEGSVQMVYADPPFNTGRTQERRTLAAVASENGDRTGFGGRRYATTLLQQSSYRDSFDDYLGFLEPRLRELRRVLSPEGTLYLHLDYREAHYAKLLLDELFGRACFLNELIWAYDYGAKSRRRWPQKHDTILVYVRDPDRYWFDCDAVDRARQAADLGDVAHDRLPHRPREDGLSDAEARRPDPALRAGLLAPGRPLPGPVRRLGHARRRRRRARAPLPADRLQRGRRRRHAGPSWLTRCVPAGRVAST
jgi:hypothetical protein